MSSVNAAAAVLAGANATHGTRWTLIRPLQGGSQQGAYELRDIGGERAVLKWHTGHLPAPQLVETARAIEDARRRGWPTSKWLVYGALANDGAYIIEEFLDGTKPSEMTAELLDRLLQANRIQDGLCPRPFHDWSAYAHRVVFENESDNARRLRVNPRTVRLMDRIDRATASARGIALPSGDLVHGDCNLWNVLVQDDGASYLVDAAHVGSGTRAYDLANLLIGATIDQQWPPGSAADQERLQRECEALVGRDGLIVCVAARLIVMVEWSSRRRPPDHFGALVARCEALVERLTDA